MTDLIQVILLGIIEGITEFLPISSTGHLLIAEKFGLGERSDVFNVVIQAGAILAVTFIYWQRLWDLTTGFAKPENRDYALKLLTAFLITCVLGLVVTKLGFKLPTEIAPIAWALLIGGFWMLAAEKIAAKLYPSPPINDVSLVKKDGIWSASPESVQASSGNTYVSWTAAILVGVGQIVAGVFPGTSRSATTIFVAMLAGTSNRAAATEFAFLVGIPTMYAASGYELLKQFRHGGGIAGENWSDLGIAFVVSTIVAFIAVKWLLRYIQTHRFTLFAVYRIVLGAGLLLMVH